MQKGSKNLLRISNRLLLLSNFDSIMPAKCCESTLEATSNCIEFPLDFDLDAAAFLLGDSGKVSNSGDFVFYGNLSHASGSVVHQGDNLTGVGEGDDEQIKIDLSNVPELLILHLLRNYHTMPQVHPGNRFQLH